MSVSLYDTMRPVAIAAGLGFGCAGLRGFPLLVVGLVGLGIGIVAFFLAGRAARLWFARHVREPAALDGDAHAGTSAGEGRIATVYIAVFVVLLLTTIAGSYFGRWLLNESTF